MRSIKKRIALLLIPVAAFVLFVGYKANQKHILIWLPDYVRGEIARAFEDRKHDGPTDIMLILADHHEITKLEKEERFLERLKSLADRHEDSDGKKLQYTFFYVYDKFHPEIAKAIASVTAQGYGDMELHWHMRDETSQSFRAKLKDAKKKFGEVGALTTIDGQHAFAFIHGNWNLDNTKSETGSRSGVNNELDLLREEGCFADFTFPAFGTVAQPKIVNTIYYALDDPDKPKSYDTGIPVEAGKPKPGERYFMIFQGAIIVGASMSSVLEGERPVFIDRGAVQDSDPPTPKRADRWVENGVYVKGRPEWKFVKLHMHGAYHPDAVLGDDMDRTLSHLEKDYNDGERYRLHYVTAREAYNIVKAAEAGLSGNPNQYREYLIREYAYTTN